MLISPPLSDGLWDFATDEKVMEVVLSQPQKSPADIGKALITEARMGGSEDDVTVIAVRCVKRERGNDEGILTAVHFLSHCRITFAEGRRRLDSVRE